MSLYYDATSALSVTSKEGSLKSCIYNRNATFKSKPGQIYALISETAKYDTFLKEVIENAQLLVAEPKLSPLLSLLLVHDHFLAKGGIAAPVSHPLRQAIERHKARLQAEFTKSRLRRKCPTVEELRKHLRQQKPPSGTQPRWVRVNTIKTSVQGALDTTFSHYTQVPGLAAVLTVSSAANRLCIDEHIPDLLALPSGHDLSKTAAYKAGELILQDKASCFPAQLLLGHAEGYHSEIGDILDACAAPGNKTSHLASILGEAKGLKGVLRHKIYASERDPQRSLTLQKMMSIAGADSLVTVLPKQDFFTLDPQDSRFRNVTHILLDPSCSGSGIVGREDIPQMVLPAAKSNTAGKEKPKKRKRSQDRGNGQMTDDQLELNNLDAEETFKTVDSNRLQKLSSLQTRIIEHAFKFPAAWKLTYSTCSIHEIENEDVVARAISSQVAQDRGWRVFRRDEQARGMRIWPHRGVQSSEINNPTTARRLTGKELDACIRCTPGTQDGTIGFFVCGFIRGGANDGEEDVSSSDPERESVDAWEGFSDM